MTDRKLNQGRTGLGPVPRALLVAFAAVPLLAGCDTDSILEVEDPEFPTEQTLNRPELLPVRVAGALGDFQVAYSGPGGDSFLSSVGVFTDEFFASGTFTTRINADQRKFDPPSQGNLPDAAFSRLHRARRSLNRAVIALREANGSTETISQLEALRGFTYVALAEGFCSGIPFSEEVNGEFVAGTPLSTAQVFDSAVVIFNQALSTNPNNQLARVGLGRAYLGLGRYSDAAAAVANVPNNFLYAIEHSANSFRQNNPIAALQQNGRYSVSSDEGGSGPPFDQSTDGEGLNFAFANDPRVPVQQNGTGFDRSSPLLVYMKYASLSDNVPLASGVEARLIQAEAALTKGQSAAYLPIVNQLRASVGLAPLTDPGTAAGRVNQFFRERAFFLFAQGKRLGDLRRLVTQYGRSPSSVYPTGPYFKGDVYGNDVVFPIPFDEVNNPEFATSQCNTTQA